MLRREQARGPDTSRRRPRRFAVAVVLLVVLVSGCDWTQFRFGPEHTGYNPLDTAIAGSNVAHLRRLFVAHTGGVYSSPVVANGEVYVSSEQGVLYAFDAAGKIKCSGVSRTCLPLWVAHTGGNLLSSPAVVDGEVYVDALGVGLLVFDATGHKNCSGKPRTCAPLWTASLAGQLSAEASPTVAYGIVYVSSFGEGLLAFDATGNKNCSGTPKTCSPLWSDAVAASESSVTVAGGIAYYAAANGGLYAFDATTGATRWSVSTAALPSTPAVANGVVFVHTFGVFGNPGTLYAFNAATGATRWTASAPFQACGARFAYICPGDSPTVANRIVYASGDAFNAAGKINCGGTPRRCSPLWTVNGSLSPAVANGVGYTNSGSGLIAFDATGNKNCGGTPKRCSALWTGTRGPVDSSPTIANGRIYVGSEDGNLYVYSR
jgi:outer membrane protein assembly factor BamB